MPAPPSPRRHWLPSGGLALLLLLTASLSAPVAGPAEIGVADRTAIRGVISRQIEAFRQDDGGTAFSFASPTIQGIFRTPELFMEMVRRSYRPVYRLREVRFDQLIDWRGVLTQRVILIGPEGQIAVALYEMQRQPNGEWKINGCYLFEAGARAT